MTYDRNHRFLLRLIAGQGVLTLDETKEIVRSVSGDEEIVIEDMVKEINKKIKPFQQMIKIVNDELTSDVVVVFVSFGFDEATKSQSVFSAVELEFFRVLMQQIMTTEARQITDMAALNLVNNIRGLTKVEAQKTLDTWRRMRFLDKDAFTNNYALGVRAIHEFEEYLHINMHDLIQMCVRCQKIVYRGYNCPGCSQAVHTRCLEKYLTIKRNWPCCDLAYNNDQLERLNGQRSPQSSEASTVVSDQEMEVEEVIPEDTIRQSKRASLKRKRPDS